TQALLARTEAVCAETETSVYIVGGSIRDALLGLPIPELDVTVIGDALALGKAIAARARGTFVPLDVEHGVGRVVITGDDGNQSHLDLARMEDGSLQADLRRRDFTVNALALPLEAAHHPDWPDHIVDPLGGVHDLRHGILRLASPTAFADDPARLLRAVRIAAQRALALDPSLKSSAIASCALVDQVAPDRLRDEFMLILETPDPTEALHLMDSLGLLMCLFPEMEPMRGCQQPAEHHWDVLEHTLQAVGACQKLLARTGLPDEVLQAVPWDEKLQRRFAETFAHGFNRQAYVKLACLLHDIGKPATKTTEPSGRIRFLGHPDTGAAMAESIMVRLRFSGKAIKHVSLMVEEHLRPTQIAPPRSHNAPAEPRLPSRRAIWRYYRDLEDAAIDTLYLSLADHLAARGPEFEFPRWQRHATICSSILGSDTHQGEVRKPRLITGRDLIEQFRLKPGPRVGWLLEAIEEAAGAGEIATREEAVALASRLLGSVNRSSPHARNN
ncbi:MAG: HD domain-containing protein, partial [Dehalococcoidia bacterium]